MSPPASFPSSGPSSGSFPSTRLRRLRSSGFIRDLTKEHRLHTSDLILPIFALNRSSCAEDIPSMPGVQRQGFDQVYRSCEQCMALGIRAIALFGVIENDRKSSCASEAFNPGGLIPSLIREIRPRFPYLGIIADVALDSYTPHGHDGLVSESGEVLNDATLAVLARQALCLADSGAQIIAPSDMMDGRVRVTRKILEKGGHHNVAILSYAAKYASAFYGPFRGAIGAGGEAGESGLGPEGKTTYQLDPLSRQQALREATEDVSEGADILMVKPAGHYLDIVREMKDQLRTPVFVYQVSGEYAALKAGAQLGWLDERAVVLEALGSMKRAGSDGIFTYYAIEAARWLGEIR